VFEKHKIQAIFAVTKEVKWLYESFPTVFKNSFVQTLEDDSGNLISVITSAYNKIKNIFTLEKPNFPANVVGSHRLLCPNSGVWVNNALQCDVVKTSDEVVIELTMTASCPADPNARHVINLSAASKSAQSEIHIEYVCECDCLTTKLSNVSSQCNARGNTTCGICNCESGWSGPNCQCESKQTTKQLVEKCMENTNEAAACSGEGECDCGSCKCSSRKRFGDYCQCISTGCAKAEGSTDYCGGSERGYCENCNNDQMCKCVPNSGWSLSLLTRMCDCSDTLCTPPPSLRPANDTSVTPSGGQPICSGHGSCDCNKCVCSKLEGLDTYEGEFCETCIHPSCRSFKSTCDEHSTKACADCLYNGNIRDCDSVCEEFSGQVVEQFADCESCRSVLESETCKECAQINKVIFQPQHCVTTMTDGCVSKYQIAWNTAHKTYQLSVKRRNFEKGRMN